MSNVTCRRGHDQSDPAIGRVRKDGTRWCRVCATQTERVASRRRYKPKPRPSALERFLAKVDKTETCWLWIACKSTAGYGDFGNEGEAHRWSYKHFVGPIPEGLELDHLCRVRNCVNPAHLEPVTHRENVLRGDAPCAKNALVTHCPAGHPYDDENTRQMPRGGRKCRACHRKWVKEAKRKRRAAA